MKVATQFAIEPMRVEQIPSVSAIERLSFPQPWPESAYKREIEDNRSAHYLVAKLATDELIDEALTEDEIRAASGDGLFERITRFLRTSNPAPPNPALERELRSIIGYAGLWLMTDEAHVTTIASHPTYRGKGIGELLLLGLIDRALAINARWMTLEVRVSNTVAQNLYRKYTFKEMGVRRRYYSDDGEDALVMWTDALDSEPFIEALARNEQKLGEKLSAEIRLTSEPRIVGQ